MSQKGFSTSELVVALAIGALILLAAVPAFSNMVAKSRVNAAARELIGDLREARGQAIATGWECKVFGFGAPSTNGRRNQYRMLARKTSAVAWPSDTAAPFRSSTQWAEPWVSVTTNNPGVSLDPGGLSAQDRFEVTFTSRGTATTSTNAFNPFRLLGKKDAINLTLSPVGGISTAVGTLP